MELRLTSPERLGIRMPFLQSCHVVFHAITHKYIYHSSNEAVPVYETRAFSK